MTDRPKHLAHMTRYTREGMRDMRNRKPFRRADRKAEAKRTARKFEDGTFRARVPVSFH